MRIAPSIPPFITLALTWWVCSGLPTPFFLVAGVLSCIAAGYLSHRMRLWDDPILLGLPMLRAPAYWLWLLKEMAISGLRVIRLILSPRGASSPGFGWVKSDLQSPAALAAYANSITLTPGTITVQTHRHEGDIRFHIHALEPQGLADLHKGDMQTRVHRFMQGKQR